jgi:hypothetical protein
MGQPSSDRTTDGLANAERAALERLGAANGYATSWPVGRAVTRSLARHGLVLVASDYVLLTDAGRRALLSDRERGGRPPASGPG